MRQTELRRFLVRLAAVASPLPLTVAACGGTTRDIDRGAEGPGGSSTAGAAGGGGAAGFPVSAGGGGPPVYMGSGGYPIYTGVAPSGGGYPMYLGTGGASQTAGGATSAGGSPVHMGDASVYCGAQFIVPLPSSSDAGSALDCTPCGTAPLPSLCEKVTVNGEPYLQCTRLCVGGRRPAGLEASAAPGQDELRAYFEEMSRLEAASVPAFRTLAHELRVHGAPRSLRRAARRAARDEIRHARLGKVLAERFGGTYQRPRIARKPLRSVEEIALDNAREGCVRETFGAMVATWQARAATDPVVRRIMRSVAVDETRHAALALRVAEWAARRLDGPARERVHEARRGAAQTVLRELKWEPSAPLASIGGLPRGPEARALAASLYERLWA